MTPTPRPDPPRPGSSLRRAVGQFTRLLRLARSYWSPMAAGIALGLVAGVLGVAVPYVTKLLIDEVYPAGDASLMHVLVAALLAVSGATAVIGAVRSVFSSHVRVRLAGAAQLLFFNHLQHLPMRFFDRRQVGEITSRFQDVSLGVNSLGQVFEVVFTQGVFVLLVPPMLFVLDARLLPALVVVPLIATLTALASLRLRRLWQRSSEAHADVNAYQVEVLSHIRTFKGMALEGRVFAEALRRTSHAGKSQLRAASTAQGLSGLSALLRAVNTAALTWLGWTLILGGELSLGAFVAFSTYVTYLYTPLFMVIQLFSDFQQSAVHLGRMFEYLDTEPEQEPTLAYAPPPPPARRVAGAYRLEGVSLSYGSEHPALADLDLEIPAGAVTAVVGPSGAGKTSLLRLLAALEAPERGTVLLDGRPMADLALADVRRQVAVVWQGSGLIKGTLWDNLVLGCEREPPREEVDRAVEVCGLADVLAESPGGYASEVAEWGASLSAGQQQRVAIARALLRDAPILILDEATANVDLETEALILRRLLDRCRGRTVVLVSHRLATAALADRVVVLEHGRVVGVGPHRELLASCPPYRRMRDAAVGDRGADRPAAAVLAEAGGRR
jgi:ABC-type bacteriocin/lantibiotic exporter with double-glycine peptidase domain